MTPNSAPEWLVVVLGLIGQGLFSARLLVQWIASERRHQSVVPLMFWHLSIAGGVTLFAYAAYRRDPVFMLGQGFGLVVYVRNLWLLRHPRVQAAAAAPTPAHAPGHAPPLATADERP